MICVHLKKIDQAKPDDLLFIMKRLKTLSFSFLIKMEMHKTHFNSLHTITFYTSFFGPVAISKSSKLYVLLLMMYFSYISLYFTNFTI